MQIRKLAEYFQKLESTASRNAMVEILARLFGEARAGEIDKIVYLTQGRVAPLFEPVEFGMAEKMVLRVLAKAYETDQEKVAEAFKKSGDLGRTAEELATGHRGGKGYSVEQVFGRLKEITQSGGEGSVEKKTVILSEIFQSVDPLSARYIARIPVDKMRLGFSDMTVLEGLSWMIDGTKKNKPVMEAAYNIRPDLGFIAGQVKKGGVAGLRRVRPQVGTPILSMRAERLTNAEEILEKGGGRMAVEPKIDGFRIQLHFRRGGGYAQKESRVRLFSRGLEEVTTMYPDIEAAAEKEITANEAILDGEAIGFDPRTGKFLPFQETVQRKRKYGIAEMSLSIPLKLIVFDCLYADGESLLDRPYKVRRRAVEKLLAGGKTIIPAEMKEVNRASELEEKFKEYLGKGLEGLMAKKLDGVYQAGARGWNWIKLKESYTDSKLADTIDAVVMGLDYGQGKRSGFGVGAFLIGVYDQKSDSYKTVSKIGTGLTDEEWRTLAHMAKKLEVKERPKNYEVNKIMNCDLWVKPELVGEFLADEITKSPMHTAGWALRFPRLVQWREKKPEDTTSLKEIEEMVRLRRGRGDGK